MNRDTVESLVDRAFDQVQDRDFFLLQNNVHERTIIHKFAAYLQQGIDEEVGSEDLFVDCEYNREGHGETKTLPEPEEKNEEDQIYPDVIIHERGSHSENLLVIEAKKESNPDNYESDKERLKILTNDEDYLERYDYDHGLFLLIHVGENWLEGPEKDWYPKNP